MSLERNIQKQFTNKLGRLGFVRKIEATSYAGMPDLLFICKGKVYFLEIKTDTGVLSKVQEHTISLIRREGGDARVIVGRSGMDAFIQEVEG